MPGDDSITSRSTPTDSIFKQPMRVEQVCVRILAARCARSFARISAPRNNKRVQGKPGARCTRGLVCKVAQKAHTSIQVQRRTPGFPCAMALRLIRDLPGEPSSVATVVRRIASANLAPASGARTTRFRRTLEPRASGVTLSVHRIPPRVRDDRDPPLSSGETGRISGLICHFGKAEYFFQRG